MKRFKDGARVCFVGDSITHTGIFIKHVLATYREQFPESGVELYNCGISGGNLGNTIAVFDKDIAIYEPTHIVLMIGINDSGRGYLKEPRSKQRYEALLGAYERYKNNMAKFYAITRERGIELILCTPMPYEEYMESDEVTYPGGFSLVSGYADFVRGFAALHGLPLCDYHREALAYMQREVIHQPDRVHPTPRGHEIMARIFLSLQGLEMSEKPFSPDVEAWYSDVQRLRDVVATEYLLISDYLSLTDAERVAAIAKMKEAIDAGECRMLPYFVGLVEGYVENKPREAELVESVKRFMKKK
ncbi:MAG: hypothetical protein IJD51_00110 [Clostridia bacterium]|nr:hypothetical protein [Clostridia bacterium]